MTVARNPVRINVAVEQACRECQVDFAFAGSVYAYVEEGEDSRPACCGSSCDPCVQLLATAARRALILLEKEERNG